MLDHPFLRGLRPTLHIAHRGGAALAPENTMAAFRQALERHGADMLEMDVHVTSDGEVVVCHDETVGRCTDGEGAVAQHSLAEIERLDAGYHFTLDGTSYPYRGAGLRIPRLSEVLSEFSLRLNIDLKASQPGAELLLASQLRRARAVDRVCVGSGDDEVASRLLAALPEACHFYPSRALAATCGSVFMGSTPDESPYLVLDMPLYMGDARLLTRPLLDWARSAGRWINVWTVDEIEEMRRLVTEGVGGIMTDRPDRLSQVLAGAGPLI